MLQTFLELLMIKVHSHISVGGPTDYCQDVRRLTEEHGISTVVFPWESRSTSPGHQIAQVERLMHTAQCQARFCVSLFGCCMVVLWLSLVDVEIVIFMTVIRLIRLA